MQKTKHKSIIVVPHFDDEIFQTGSILLNYKNDIDLLITHPTDCISKQRFLSQLEMFKQCLNLINTYRKIKGYVGNIQSYVYTLATFNGYMNDHGRKRIQTRLESCFFDKVTNEPYNIDYFVYTEESTHQSHLECNHICNSICRSPYIENIKDIMLATYPQSEFGIKFNKNNNINSYIPITQEQVSLMCDCIGKIYGEKNHNTTILGADNFETYLKFFGERCGNAFAQPFCTLRHLYTL